MYHSRDPIDLKFLDAALSSIQSTGLASITSRDLAEQVGQSAAAINRRFGGQQALINLAVEMGTQRECKRLKTIADTLDGVAAPENQSAPFLMTMMRELEGEMAHGIVFRWNINAMASPATPYSEQRIALARTLDLVWSSVGNALGLTAEQSHILRLVLERVARVRTLSQYPALYDGWAYDIGQRLLESMKGKARTINGDSSWRREILRRVKPESHFPNDDDHPTKRAITVAAAHYLRQNGPFSATHRRIAEEAGVSLSSATHHFRSLKDILYSACLEMIAERLRDADQHHSLTQEQTLAELQIGMTTNVEEPNIGVGTALNQLELAAYHKDEFKTLGDMLALRAGSSSINILGSVRGRTHDVDMLDAIIWHHASMSLFEQALTLPVAKRAAYVHQTVGTVASYLTGAPL